MNLPKSDIKEILINEIENVKANIFLSENEKANKIAQLTELLNKGK